LKTKKGTEVLSTELKTYERERSRLIAEQSNLGQFALIHGDSIAGLYSTFETALAAGYDKFGLEPFLVKEVTVSEKPRYFSRNLR
jgi:hypothetical protein